MARLRYNGLSTTLGGSGLTNSATSVTFGAALTHSNGTNVPTITGSDYIPLAILDSSGHLSEIVWLTAYTAAGTTGTIARGKENTTGVAHSSGDKVIQGPLISDLTGTVLVTDDFTRADSATSLGGAWTTYAGTWGISTNKAYVAVASGSPVAALEVGQSDMSVKARITSASNDEGLVARLVDANNFYSCDFLTGTSIRLLKKVAGSFTTLGTNPLPGGVSLTAFDFELRCKGDVITVIVNGATAVGAVDASLSGTKAGLWQGTGKTTPRWDDFVVTAP